MIAVFGIVPTSALGEAANKASYSTAANSIAGGGSWAGNLVALAGIISGIGALNGSTMICAEMPLAAAKDGLFPTRFRRLSARGVPAFGIVSSTALASIAMVISYMGANGATVFTTLVLMTGITAAVPYAFSALAQLKWRFHDHQVVHTPRLVRDVSVAIVALAFSLAFIYYSRNTGDTWYIVWGPFMMSGGAFLLGIPVYRAQRGRRTEPEAAPSCR
jgi:APA family basic amino acid/polyamine antiporter